jgi:hypothetical protein
MKKVLLVAALAILTGFSVTGKATAQETRSGTEVCVNRSGVDEAKRLFPNARVHVIPDSTDPNMNGWRIVYGASHTDAEELRLRRSENRRDLRDND